MGRPGTACGPGGSPFSSAGHGGVMEYQICVKQVESQTTAVVRRRASPQQLAQVVPQGCGEVWAYLRAAQFPHPGRNLALYLDCDINLEVGVEVDQAFAGDGRVVCSQTPA